jgi:hypothetical protein
MSSVPERRGVDRRRLPRGGRRAEDSEGFSPLVMLVGNQPSIIEGSEAILAKLRFAVATSNSVEDALRALPDLKPDLIVAAEADEARLRSGTPAHVPVVVMSPGMQENPEALVEAIRRTLRAAH